MRLRARLDARGLLGASVAGYAPAPSERARGVRRGALFVGPASVAAAGERTRRVAFVVVRSQRSVARAQWTIARKRRSAAGGGADGRFARACNVASASKRVGRWECIEMEQVDERVR